MYRGKGKVAGWYLYWAFATMTVHAQDSVVFNEILFNPPAGGADYIEIFNAGSRPVAVADLQLANPGKKPKAFARDGRTLSPGGYLAITKDPAWVMAAFPGADSAALVSLATMPSLPDDAGELLLLRADGTVIDSLAYDHRWHFGLVAGEEGVALERISAAAGTNDPNNWTSAAGTNGYGTPTRPNSHQNPGPGPPVRGIAIDERFSPDNDGFEDSCNLRLTLPDAGWACSVSVFDAGGRLRRRLIRNKSVGTVSRLSWDGLDDSARPLPPGRYIVLVELYNTDGRTQRAKKVVVLARRF